ncbi:MAG: DUF2169 domain-containing protein [Rhodocyclaceae bacterium]
MRVIKPFTASLLTRSFEFKKRQYLGISVLLYTPMGDVPMLLPEKDLWPFWATQPEAAGPLEESFPRRRAEYLVCGSAYTTPQRRDGVAVRARVGNLAKDLAVWGQRYWDGNRISPATPFESLPLGWTRTYGGADFASNPLGMGRADTDLGGHSVRLLPNIEYIPHPLTSPRDEGVPAAFSPIDQMWPQRAAMRGTYDERWLKEEFPAIASDADWRFFNVAPGDQQQDAAFSGTEAYAFENMHPEKAVVSGHLPGVTTRVFATRVLNGEQLFQEVITRLTALWFFPAAERVIQVFQGTLEVTEDDASDVSLLMAAIEKLGEQRPIEHYHAVRDKRLDKKKGALETLRESDLAPADLAQPIHDFTPTPNRALERGTRRAELEREAARAEVAKHGLDPDEHAPPVKAPPPPVIKSIDDLIAFSEKAFSDIVDVPVRMAAEKAKLMADAKAVFDREGLDFSVIERETAGLLTSGPPKPGAPKLVEDFKGLVAQGKQTGADIRELEEMLADPKVQAQWKGGDEAAMQGYRLMAQHQAPANMLGAEASAALKQRLLAAHVAGQSLAGWDLTGIELADVDLTGADLTDVLLECAVLKNCCFNGAKLGNALLVRARLEDCRFEQAQLAQSNLSAAHIEHCSFNGADLTGVTLEKTALLHTDLCGTRLDGIGFNETHFENVDFSAARSDTMLTFRGLTLHGVRFAQAHFTQSIFLECDLGAADFSEARLDKVVFVTVRASQAKFRKLVVGSGCFAMGCQFDGADFSGAKLERVGMRGTQFTGAEFSLASLRGSDLSECDLRGARFYATDARDALFVRAQLETTSLASANLANAVLMHARLGETDFRHANLHEADLARVRVGPNVKFENALLTRVRTYPRHTPEVSA